MTDYAAQNTAAYEAAYRTGYHLHAMPACWLNVWPSDPNPFPRFRLFRRR